MEKTLTIIILNSEGKNMKQIPRFKSSSTVKELVKAAFPHEKIVSEGGDLEVFTKKFAQYIGASYAVPAPLARVALNAILCGLNLSQKGEVILPSLTFHCIPAMFQKLGLKPRFVDIKPDTYCMDADQLEEAITPSTVAIVPVHLYGRACDMKTIMEVAKRYNLAVIEDCAQSCGAVHSGKRLGSFGQGAIFSFHPHKNISVLGAGMLTTNSKEIADKAVAWMKQFPIMSKAVLAKRILYVIGMRFVTQPWFWNSLMAPSLRFGAWAGVDMIELLTSELPGWKGRSVKPSWLMPRSFHGRVGLSQLNTLDDLNNRRMHNGNQLLESLRNVPGVKIPSRASEGENVYSTFVVRVKDRQGFRRRMRRFGVDTHGGNMFVGPHLPGLEGTGKCEIASEAIEHMVHLPVYPQMNEEDIKLVSEAVIKSISDKTY